MIGIAVDRARVGYPAGTQACPAPSCSRLTDTSLGLFESRRYNVPSRSNGSCRWTLLPGGPTTTIGKDTMDGGMDMRDMRDQWHDAPVRGRRQAFGGIDQ